MKLKLIYLPLVHFFVNRQLPLGWGFSDIKDVEKSLKSKCLIRTCKPKVNFGFCIRHQKVNNNEDQT